METTTHEAPRSESAAALLGPPWRTVDARVAEAMRGEARQVPRVAYAVYDAQSRSVERVASEEEAVLGAVRVAARGDGRASIYTHVVRLRAGAWLWMPGVSIDVSKALRPGNVGDFAVIVERQRAAVLRAAVASRRAGIATSRAALGAVRWADASRAVVERAFRAVREAIEAVPRTDPLHTALTIGLGAAARSVAAATLRERGVEPPESVLGAAEQIAGATLPDVDVEYERRAVKWDSDARLILFGGLRDERTDAEIAGRLDDATANGIAGRDDFYYAVLVASVLTRARSLGALQALQRNGVTKFRWRAQIDTRTCDICRFMHGTEYSIADAMQQMGGASPPAWFRVDGDRIDAGGRTVARIQRTGVGTRSAGTYAARGSVASSGATLTPPAHGHCRCRIEPVEDE